MICQDLDTALVLHADTKFLGRVYSVQEKAWVVLHFQLTEYKTCTLDCQTFWTKLIFCSYVCILHETMDSYCLLGLLKYVKKKITASKRLVAAK